MIPHVNDTKNEFEDEDLQYAEEQAKHVKWYHQVLLNRPLKVVLALIFVAIAVPILIYQLAFYSAGRANSIDGFSFGSCLVPRVARLPCGLGYMIADECHDRCCYDSANNLCFHRFPSRFSYIMDQHWAEDVILRPRVSTVPFKSQPSLTNIRLSLDEVSSSHLTITYYNSTEHSFTGRRIESKDYAVQISSPELNLEVNSTGRIIFSTVRGPLVASKNIWEIAFKLTNETMYGFGEIPIRGNTVKIIYNHKGGMTSIPLIFAKTNTTYHGLLIDTVDPTEVSFREDNVVVIRSITNFGLKFHVFVGPKPVDVMNDVRKLIGHEEDLQYWMLGAHVCSESDEIPQSNVELNNFIQEATTQSLPFESHCVIPVVFDDTCEMEPVEIVNEGADILHNAGKRFIPHVSPYVQIRYRANDMTENENDTIINSASCNSTIDQFEEYMLQDSEATGPYKGVVGNYDVVYPNYGNITAELMAKLWVYTTNIDGVVLENSWPLDESEKFVNETKHYLPYFSQNFEEAFNHTPRWNATNSNGEKHLHVHNEYGNHFVSAFDKVKVNTQPTWVSNHWMNGSVFMNRQSINTTWTSLQNELTEAALGGVSGQWHWSTPICGDMENFDSEIHLNLCVKWYMAATYFPMIKIHSKGRARHPLSFRGTHRSLMINALRTRMMLAPYFYTTLKEGPLLRPMFYQFPESESLKDITSQFSVGNDLLIVPNLQPNQAIVHVRIPPGIWYELWSGLKVEGEVGETVTMATTEADFFTAIRGGAIVVLQKDVKLSAEETRAQSNISLTIALNCEDIELSRLNNTTCQAEGYLYITKNVTVTFSASYTQLTIRGNLDPVCQETEPIMAFFIKEVNVYGLNNTLNNYDHMKVIDTDIDLCKLSNEEFIQFYD